jgi:hypothetical protein
MASLLGAVAQNPFGSNAASPAAQARQPMGANGRPLDPSAAPQVLGEAREGTQQNGILGGFISNGANLGGNIVGPNLQYANQLYNGAQQAGNISQQNIAQQQGLYGSLGQVVNGQAPSVAQQQLGAGLGAIQAAQQSNAAGATGQNAALANMNAAQNMGAAQAQANQQAALIRAQEVAQARAQQGQVLGQVGQESQQMAGQNLNAAGVAGNTAATANAEQSKEEAARVAENKKALFGGIEGAGNFLAAL